MQQAAAEIRDVLVVGHAAAYRLDAGGGAMELVDARIVAAIVESRPGQGPS